MVSASSALSSFFCYRGLVESEYRSMFLKLFPRYAGRAGCVPRFVEKERRPPLRHQGIRSGGNLRVFENLAQTLVAVDAP